MRKESQTSLESSYRWILAFEDGYFKFEQKLRGNGKTVLVGVLFDWLTPVNVGIELIDIDGLDGTEKAIRIVKRLGKANVIFLGGITYAGFNIIDPIKLHENFKSPIIVVTSRHPNDELVERALTRHFIDAEYRFSILKSFRSKTIISQVKVGNSTVYIQPLGLNVNVATELVSKLTVKGARPEPLRLAKLIASSLGRLLYSINV